MQYILQLYNIVVLLLSFGKPRYGLCTAVYTAAIQFVILLLSFKMPRYRLCNAVYTTAEQYCYIIIIIRNAKEQTVQCIIYCSCTIFLYYSYHLKFQVTDGVMQYILQLYNIVILLFSFGMQRYRLCNAEYTVAVQYCYIIIII